MDDVTDFSIQNFHVLIMYPASQHFLRLFKRIAAMKTLALILALAIAAPLAAHAANTATKTQTTSQTPAWIQNQNNLLAPY